MRAECINQAQRVSDGVWIETVLVRTTPRQDLALLATRDELSRIVLETLDQAATGELAVPGDVRDLLKILPVELRDGLEADLTQRTALLDDVRALLLASLDRGA